MNGHWTIRPGFTSLAKALAWDYGLDCGSAHVRSYHLFLASVGLGPLSQLSIGRYLDGEEEREGTYR